MTGKVKAMWQELQDAKDEEKFLLEQYESARFDLEQKTKEAQWATTQKRGAEQRLDDVKQALIDYAEGNGIVETDNFSISETRAVDITDLDSVPEEYIRTKITKEVNKAAIQALKLPESNWLKYKVSKKINFKKGAENE